MAINSPEKKEDKMIFGLNSSVVMLAFISLHQYHRWRQHIRRSSAVRLRHINVSFCVDFFARHESLLFYWSLHLTAECDLSCCRIRWMVIPLKCHIRRKASTINQPSAEGKATRSRTNTNDIHIHIFHDAWHLFISIENLSGKSSWAFAMCACGDVARRHGQNHEIIGSDSELSHSQ